MARKRYNDRSSVVLKLFGATISFSAFFYILKDYKTMTLVLSGGIFMAAAALALSSLAKRKKRAAYLSSGIQSVDLMSGVDFENFLQAHFSKLGYKVDLTPQSNDYGADLLMTKDGLKTAVQAKRYSTKKTVGIKAVQETIGAVHHYGADRGMIVTNNYYSSQAKALAASANIELIDRSQLIDIMRKNGSKDLLESLNIPISYNSTRTIVGASESSKICPSCGAALLTRNGKHGAFIGCSSFPKCSYTRHIATAGTIQSHRSY